MAKIRSIKELVYDSRNGSKGIIQLEVDGWEFKPTTNSYLAKINDYVIEKIQVEEVEQEIKKFISTKNVNYPSEQIDQLFYLLQNPIELTESYSAEMDKLIAQALLCVTEQDPIYGSLANDWVIKP